MKFIPLLLLLIVMPMNFLIASEKVIYLGIVKSTKGLILRQSPSQTSKKITNIANNSEIYIIDKSQNKVNIDGITDYWYKIKLWSEVGWSFGGYIILINEITESDFIKSIQNKKIEFRQGSDCIGYTESEWHGTLKLFPNKNFIYEYQSTGSYECPEKSNEDCMYNSSTSIIIKGTFSIYNKSRILFKIVNANEEINFDEKCCPPKYNKKNILKLKKQYLFRISTCNLNGFNRIMLTSIETGKIDSPFLELTFNYLGIGK